MLNVKIRIYISNQLGTLNNGLKIHFYRKGSNEQIPLSDLMKEVNHSNRKDYSPDHWFGLFGKIIMDPLTILTERDFYKSYDDHGGSIRKLNTYYVGSNQEEILSDLTDEANVFLQKLYDEGSLTDPIWSKE